MSKRVRSTEELLREIARLEHELALATSGSDAPAMTANEDRFRSIVEAIDDGVWATDLQGRTIFLNKKMASMLGYRVVDMLGKNMADFLLPDATPLPDTVLQSGADPLSARQDILFRQRNGKGLWTRVTSSPMASSGGVRIGILNVVSDINRRKQYEAQLQADSDLFRQFGEAVNEIVRVTRWPEHVVEYVSPAYEQIWGRRRSDLYENPVDWVDGIHPADRRRVQAAFEAGVEEGGYDETFRIVRPDSTTRWIRDRGFPVRDAEGRVHRVAGIAEDVTERKLAEIFQTGQSRVLSKLATGQSLHDVLEALVQMIEAQSEEMVGSVLLFEEASGRLFHGAATSLSPEYCQAVDGLQIGPSAGSCGTAAFRREIVIVEDVSIDPLWADYRDLMAREGLRACWSQPIFDSGGELLGTFAMYYPRPRRPTARDLALIGAAAHLAGIAIERRRNLDRLAANESRLRQVLDLVPHMIFAKDRSGTLLLANRALAEAYGTTVERLVGSRHGELHGERDEVRRMLADDVEVIDSGRMKFIPEEFFTDRAGNVRILQTTKIPFRQSGSGEPAMLGIALDITERKELERQVSDHAIQVERIFLEDSLRSMNPRTALRQLYDSSPDFLVTLDPAGRLIEANAALRESLGLRERDLRPAEFIDLVAAPSRERTREWLDQLLQRGRVGKAPCDLRRGDGPTLATRCSGRVQRDGTGQVRELRLVMQDLGRREHRRRHLLQTEQWITTGRLAASVSHEVNNPLQALLMHLALIESALPADFAERQSWKSVQDGIARIQEVVNGLLDLHRGTRAQPEPVDVNALVREALSLADSEFRARDVAHETRLQAGLPPVVGVTQHLYQVLLNLLLNGIEAIGRGGTVRVSTRSADGKVIIEVQDDGPGIPAEDLPRIFTPLYTRGKAGTGLGLFVSYNLIREHRGSIHVESSPGRGTLFRVELPPRGAEAC